MMDIAHRLEPRDGKRYLYEIRNRVVGSLARVKNLLAERADGRFMVRPEDSVHEPIKAELLAMMSAVLTQCPLVGSDGPHGERTYRAYPGNYHRTPDLLRELGEKLAPSVFDPIKVVELIINRSEAYKLEIKTPSDLIGFSLDIGEAIWQGSEPIRSLGFTCFDGGLAYPSSGGILTEIGFFEMNIFPDQNIAGTLVHSIVNNVHDIDTYTD